MKSFSRPKQSFITLESLALNHSILQRYGTLQILSVQLFLSFSFPCNSLYLGRGHATQPPSRGCQISSRLQNLQASALPRLDLHLTNHLTESERSSAARRSQDASAARPRVVNVNMRPTRHPHQPSSLTTPCHYSQVRVAGSGAHSSITSNMPRTISLAD